MLLELKGLNFTEVLEPCDSQTETLGDTKFSSF